LVQRSAQARAAETGASVDEILAAWAGGEIIESVTPLVTGGEPEPASDAASEEEAAAPTGPVVEIPAESPVAAATARTPTRAPIPTEVTAAEATHLPEVITVPTAGIKERTNFVIPRWLTALMLIAPFVALFALGGAATGECGEATELAADVISGEIVNCDGSEFTGAGAGGGPGDFLALGGDIYAGNVTPAATCIGCHGPNGEGSAAFPALTGVLTTFGACSDHLEWVRLGSAGWSSTYGDTYGDTNKPVNQGMPTHSALTAEQLASVVAFERVRFGGQDPDEALVDCGLADSQGGEEGEGPGGGDGTTGTTVPAGEGDASASASHSG
jgi:mono/diheme cytochrome c family protein